MHTKFLLSSVFVLCFSSLLLADSEAEKYIERAKNALKKLRRISSQIRGWESSVAHSIRQGKSLEKALRLSDLRRWENQLLKMFPLVGKELKIYRLWLTYTVLDAVKKYPDLELCYRSLLPEFPLKDEQTQALPLLLRFAYNKALLDASKPRWNDKKQVVEFPHLIAQSQGDSWIFHLKALWRNEKLVQVVEQALQDRRRYLESFHRWLLYKTKVSKIDSQVVAQLTSSAKPIVLSRFYELLAFSTLRDLYVAQMAFFESNEGERYGDFQELRKKGLFKKFDKIFSPYKAKRGGYIFLLKLQNSSDIGDSDYKIYAYPEKPYYGLKAFWLSSEGMIYRWNYWRNKKLPATSQDSTR